MQSPSVRSLVLLCSLLFVLPQGWCCHFVPPAKAGAKSACTGCCALPAPHAQPHLQARAVMQTAGNGKPGTEFPTHRCGCSQRNALRAEVAVDPGAEFVTPLLPLPGTAWLIVRREASGQVAQFVASPVRPIHVLKCVWLC